MSSVLQALRLKGRAAASELAVSLGSSTDEVELELQSLATQHLVVDRRQIFAPAELTAHLTAHLTEEKDGVAFDMLKLDPTNTFPIGSLVATVPAVGGAVRRLTALDAFDTAPDWSPDGSVLAFNTYDLGNMHGISQPSNVYLMAPDGTGQRQLTTASTDGHMRIGLPRWSSDGARLWVSVTREWETGPSGQPKAEIAWVDPVTGALHELHVEGKGPRPRPVP